MIYVYACRDWTRDYTNSHYLDQLEAVKSRQAKVWHDGQSNFSPTSEYTGDAEEHRTIDLQ